MNEKTIIIASNEPQTMKQKMFILAKENGFNIETRALAIGDIVCLHENGNLANICIERKTAEDFVKSIIDGRLFVQAQNMKENYDICVFMVSGNLNSVKVNINKNAIRGAIGSLIGKYHCSVYTCLDDNELIYTSFKIFEHSQYKIDLSKLKKFDITNESREIGMLSCIKGISNKIATRLLEKWTIREIAMIDDINMLTQIEGVGKSKAKNIIEMFSSGRKFDNYLKKIHELEKIIISLR